MQNNFDNQGRRRYGSIRELAEAMRQAVWEEMRGEGGGRLNSSDAGEEETGRGDYVVGGDDSMEDEESPLMNVNYYVPPFGGNFVNKTNMTIFICGEAGAGLAPEIRAVTPGSKRDAAYFDADFFKVRGKWYKIGWKKSVVEEKDDGTIEIRDFEREANEAETIDCENRLRKHLLKSDKYPENLA